MYVHQTDHRPAAGMTTDQREEVTTHRVSLSGGLYRYSSAFFQICVQGLLPAAEDKQGSHGDVGRLFVFAVMWSLGALLELEDRAKMEAYLKVCLTLVLLSRSLIGTTFTFIGSKESCSCLVLEPRLLSGPAAHSGRPDHL